MIIHQTDTSSGCYKPSQDSGLISRYRGVLHARFGVVLGAAVSLLILVVSMLPDRYRPIILVFSFLGALVFAFLGYQRRDQVQLAQPSINIETMGLDISKEKVCLTIMLKNSGAATAYLTSYGIPEIGDIGKLPEPLPSNSIISANGGTMPFSSCLKGLPAVLEAQAKVPISDKIRIYYHGDQGPHYSLCLSGYWDYDTGHFFGDIRPCNDSSQLRPRSRDWLPPFLIIYGVIFSSWYVLFCLVGLTWRPAFWQSVVSSLDGADGR
jgi:hypothetical protein